MGDYWTKTPAYHSPILFCSVHGEKMQALTEVATMLLDYLCLRTIQPKNTLIQSQ